MVILSDTYYEFAAPLMRQLGYPTLFCHQLVVDDAGRVVDYRLRLADQKRKTIEALRGLHFATIAAGDSYNDTAMPPTAEQGSIRSSSSYIARW